MNETATTAVADAIHRIEDVLASIRPAVRADGGDIELVSYQADTGLVRIRMLGACYACPMSIATLKTAIERSLRFAVPEVRAVEAV